MHKFAQELCDRVRDETEKFDQTGIFFYPHWSEREKDAPITPVAVRKLVRRIARNQRRPFIVAWTHAGSLQWEAGLKLPYRKMLEVPRTFLLMSAENVDKYQRWRRPDGTTPPVSRSAYTTYEIYRFVGDQGRQVFENWVSRCKNDPAWRRALKLPDAAPMRDAA